jgi:hypothetical protein
MERNGKGMNISQFSPYVFEPSARTLWWIEPPSQSIPSNIPSNILPSFPIQVFVQAFKTGAQYRTIQNNTGAQYRTIQNNTGAQYRNNIKRTAFPVVHPVLVEGVPVVVHDPMFFARPDGGRVHVASPDHELMKPVFQMQVGQSLVQMAGGAGGHVAPLPQRHHPQRHARTQRIRFPVHAASVVGRPPPHFDPDATCSNGAAMVQQWCSNGATMVQQWCNNEKKSQHSIHQSLCT